MRLDDHFSRLRDPKNWLIGDDSAAATTPPTATSARRTWPIALGAAVAVAAVVAVPVAVTAQHHTTRPSNPEPTSLPGAVTWKPLAASSPAPTADAAIAPACAPENLKLTILPGVNPAMGTDYINVTVSNAGDAGCALRDSDLNGLRWGDHHAKPAGPNETTVIAPRKTQRYRLGFSQECQARGAAATATTAVRATMAGKKLALEAPRIPSALRGCDAATSKVASAADEPDTAGPYAALRSSIDVAKEVVGGQLAYTVTVTNGGSSPLTFTRCPSYTQMLSFAGGAPIRERYQLNCGNARSLAPGADRTYAMQIDVPDEAVDDGPIKLLWMMDDGPDAGVLLNAAAVTQ